MGVSANPSIIHGNPAHCAHSINATNADIDSLHCVVSNGDKEMSTSHIRHFNNIPLSILHCPTVHREKALGLYANTHERGGVRHDQKPKSYVVCVSWSGPALVSASPAFPRDAFRAQTYGV